MKKLKQILSNKNTVTLFGAILMVLVLYFFYNIKVNQAISPIRVPYAIQEIPPRTKITSEMIGYLEITQKSLKGDIYTNVKTQIIEKNMYTGPNCTIPEGSLFYTKLLMKESDVENSYDVPMGENMLPYNLDVTMKSTYGNSMYPGNQVDIYARITDDTDGRIIIGKLYEKVKVLEVKDSAGRSVFEGTEEIRTPSQMILEVDSEAHLVLRAAEKTGGLEIILVPYGTTLSGDLEEVEKIQVTNEEIKQYIEARSTLIPNG